MIQAAAPLETIPLYVRAGAVIPLGPEMNYVDEKKGPLTFSIYPDLQGRAELSLYEDDGISQAYNNGVIRRTSIQYQSSTSGAEIDLSAPTGTYQPAARLLVFDVHAPPSVREVLLDSKALPTTGWSQTGNSLHVENPDDSQPHRIRIQ